MIDVAERVSRSTCPASAAATRPSFSCPVWAIEVLALDSSPPSWAPPVGVTGRELRRELGEAGGPDLADLGLAGAGEALELGARGLRRGGVEARAGHRPERAAAHALEPPEHAVGDGAHALEERAGAGLERLEAVPGQLGESGDPLQEAIDGAVGRRPHPLQHGLQALAQARRRASSTPGARRSRPAAAGRRPDGRTPAPDPTPARRQRGSWTRTRPLSNAPRPTARRRRRRGRAAPPGPRWAAAVRCTGGVGPSSRSGSFVVPVEHGPPEAHPSQQARETVTAGVDRRSSQARLAVFTAVSSTRLRATGTGGSAASAARCTGGISGSSPAGDDGVPVEQVPPDAQPSQQARETVTGGVRVRSIQSHVAVFPAVRCSCNSTSDLVSSPVPSVTGRASGSAAAMAPSSGDHPGVESVSSLRPRSSARASSTFAGASRTGVGTLR